MQANASQVEDIRSTQDERRTLLAGTAWGVFGAAIQQAGPILSNVVVARVLGLDEFGRYSICFSGANTLAAMGGATLSLYAASSIAARRSDGHSAVGDAAAFAVVSGSVISSLLSAALFLAMISVGTGGGKVVSPVEAGLTSLICLVTGLQTVGNGIVLGLERFAAASRMQAARGLLCAAGAMAGVTAGGLMGALVGLCLAGILGLAYSAFTARLALAGAGVTKWKWSSGISRTELRDVLAPGLLGSVLVTPSPWLVQLLLVRGENGLKQVAVFQATMMIRQVLAFLPTQLGQAGLPIFSRMAIRQIGKPDLRDRLLKLSCFFAGISSLALAAGIAVVGDRVMRIFGTGFIGAQPALIAALIAGVLLATETPLASVLVAERRMWTGVVLNAIWLAALVCGITLLAGRVEGALAGNLAYGLAYAVHGVTTALAIARLTSGTPQPAVPVRAARAGEV